MPAIPRKNILEKFHAMIAEGVPIVGGGAGTGLSAKAEEAGRSDFSSLWSGQAAALACESDAAELTRKLAQDALQRLEAISKPA